MQKHKFNTLREGLLSATAITTGLLAYGYALATMFPPALLAVTAGVVALREGLRHTREHHHFMLDLENRDLLVPVPPEHPIASFTDNASKALHLSPPKIFALTHEYIIKETLESKPRFLRSLYREFLQEKLSKNPSAALHFFSRLYAVPLARTVLVAAAALEKCPPPQHQTNLFCVAHELAHLKTDGIFIDVAKGAISQNTTLLMLAAVVTGVAANSGFTLPFLSAAFVAPFWANALMLTAFNEAAKLGLNYASRVREIRADRNALQTGASIESGISYFRTKTCGPDTVSLRNTARLFLSDLRSTHPAYIRRIWALQAEKRKYQQAAPICNRTLAP